MAPHPVWWVPTVSYLLEFDLVEDLAAPGCPMCHAAGRHSRGYLRSLMATDITDRRVRRELARAGGLCREHLLLGVEVAADEDDPMGMALVCELLLDVAAGRLGEAGTEEKLARWTVSAPKPRDVRAGEGAQQASSSSVGSIGVWVARRGRRGRARRAPACPACEAQRVIVDGYADLLLGSGDHLRRLVADPERGLCLPHCLVALERARDPAERRALVDAWTRRAGRLRSQLGELVAKRAHDRRAEPRGEEADSWMRAPEWVVGESWSAASRARSSRPAGAQRPADPERPAAPERPAGPQPPECAR